MGTTVVVRLMEIVLFIGFIIHIVQGYVLESFNLSRRGKSYEINMGNKGSKWYSRTMGLLGTLLFLFLIMHIYHFWTPSRLGGVGNIVPLDEVEYNGKAYHNLYHEMFLVFQNPFVVLLYVVGCISLCYHLMHGFASALRTLGLSNNRYLAMARTTGIGYSVIVSLAFAMMPISIYLGWISE